MTGPSTSSTKAAFVEKLDPSTGTLIAPGRWPCEVRLDGPDVEQLGALGRDGELLRGRLAPAGTARGSARRSGRGSAASAPAPLADSATNASSSWIDAIGLKRRSNPIVVEPARAHRLAAERAGDVAGEHLDAVRQLEQPPEGVEEPLGAFDRADGEVGPGRVADEERVAREDEPRLVGARRVDDGEAAVLGPVTRRVDHAHRDGADRELVAVLERRRAGTRHPPRRGCSPGRRARARGGRAPRRGRRACASRACARSGRRAARPPRASARSRAAGRRRAPPPTPRTRRGTTRSRGRRSASCENSTAPDGSTGFRYRG